MSRPLDIFPELALAHYSVCKENPFIHDNNQYEIIISNYAKNDIIALVKIWKSRLFVHSIIKLSEGCFSLRYAIVNKQNNKFTTKVRLIICK